MIHRFEADIFMVSGIVHFIQLVAAAELGADCIPYHFQQLDAFFCSDACPFVILNQIPADFRVQEICRARRQLDQSAGNNLFDKAGITESANDGRESLFAGAPNTVTIGRSIQGRTVAANVRFSF